MEERCGSPPPLISKQATAKRPSVDGQRRSTEAVIVVEDVPSAEPPAKRSFQPVNTAQYGGAPLPQPQHQPFNHIPRRTESNAVHNGRPVQYPVYGVPQGLQHHQRGQGAVHSQHASGGGTSASASDRHQQMSSVYGKHRKSAESREAAGGFDRYAHPPETDNSGQPSEQHHRQHYAQPNLPAENRSARPQGARGPANEHYVRKHVAETISIAENKPLEWRERQFQQRMHLERQRQQHPYHPFVVPQQAQQQQQQQQHVGDRNHQYTDQRLRQSRSHEVLLEPVHGSRKPASPVGHEYSAINRPGDKMRSTSSGQIVQEERMPPRHQSAASGKSSYRGPVPVYDRSSDQKSAAAYGQHPTVQPNRPRLSPSAERVYDPSFRNSDQYAAEQSSHRDVAYSHAKAQSSVHQSPRHVGSHQLQQQQQQQQQVTAAIKQEKPRSGPPVQPHQYQREQQQAQPYKQQPQSQYSTKWQYQQQHQHPGMESNSQSSKHEVYASGVQQPQPLHSRDSAKYSRMGDQESYSSCHDASRYLSVSQMLAWNAKPAAVTHGANENHGHPSGTDAPVYHDMNGRTQRTHVKTKRTVQVPYGQPTPVSHAMHGVARQGGAAPASHVEKQSFASCGRPQSTAVVPDVRVKSASRASTNTNDRSWQWHHQDGRVFHAPGSSQTAVNEESERKQSQHCAEPSVVPGQAAVKKSVGSQSSIVSCPQYAISDTKLTGVPIDDSLIDVMMNLNDLATSLDNPDAEPEKLEQLTAILLERIIAREKGQQLAKPDQSHAVTPSMARKLEFVGEMDDDVERRFKSLAALVAPQDLSKWESSVKDDFQYASTEHLFHCFVCKVKFERRSALEFHFLKHRNSECPYLCLICGGVSPDHDACNKHMGHHGHKDLTCQLCGHAFRETSAYLLHWLESHFFGTSLDSSAPKDSPSTSSDRQQVNGSGRRLSSVSSPKEQDKSAAPPSWEDMINHFHQLSTKIPSVKAGYWQNKVTKDPSIHYATDNYWCNTCEKTFKWRRDLEFHFLSHREENRPSVCHICGRCFSKADHTNRHSHVHNLTVYCCQLCGAEFQRNSHLEKHWNNDHFAPSMVQQSAGCRSHELSPSSGDFDQTLAAHGCSSPESEEIVELQSKALPGGYLEGLLRREFGRPDTPPPSRFSTHNYSPKSDPMPIGRRSVDRRRSLLCNASPPRDKDRAAKRTAATVAMIAAVVDSDLDDRPYRCRTCGRGFKRSAHLARHERDLHPDGTRPPAMVHCQIANCNAKFHKREQLCSHMQAVHGKGAIICKYCERIFTTMGALTNHAKTHQRSAKDKLAKKTKKKLKKKGKKVAVKKVSRHVEESEVAVSHDAEGAEEEEDEEAEADPASNGDSEDQGQLLATPSEGDSEPAAEPVEEEEAHGHDGESPSHSE